MAKNEYQKARYNAQRRIKTAIEKGYDIPEEMRNIPSYSELVHSGLSLEEITELAEKLNTERLVDYGDIGKVFYLSTGEIIITVEQRETMDRERYMGLFGSSDYDSTDSYYEDLEAAKERYKAEQHAKHIELFDQVNDIISLFKKESSWLREKGGGRGKGYFVDWRTDKSLLEKLWENTRASASYEETEKELFDYISNNVSTLSDEVSKLIESRYIEEYKGAIANVAYILKGGQSLTPDEAEDLALELDTINGW